MFFLYISLGLLLIFGLSLIGLHNGQVKQGLLQNKLKEHFKTLDLNYAAFINKRMLAKFGESEVPLLVNQAMLVLNTQVQHLLELCKYSEREEVKMKKVKTHYFSTFRQKVLQSYLLGTDFAFEFPEAFHSCLKEDLERDILKKIRNRKLNKY